MGRTPLPRPTDAELEILRVLWSRGPATVRDVHAALSAERRIGYTTVLKFMQIMAEKGLVTRDESQRSHVYRAAAAEADTQRQLVDDLLERAFGGSAAQLVLQALASTPASPQELAEIQRILASLEARGHAPAGGSSTGAGPPRGERASGDHKTGESPER